MSRIIYTPEQIKDPRNHPRRIYFSCHPNDLFYFQQFAPQIRAIEKDCVIAYRDPDGGDGTSHLNEVAEFHLILIPITMNWFSDGVHRAEFEHALASNKAILPILCEEQALDPFNDTTNKRHALKIIASDFDEQLQRALNAMLLDPAMAEHVRKVFTHWMFVSYCREDLPQAQELIQLVHAEEGCRRIAIWYDKYLPMGKNFEDSIFAELDRCDFFAVTLTPHIINRDNYVKQYEFPRAAEKSKKIILFEMTPADKDEFLRQVRYVGPYDFVPADPAKRKVSLSKALMQQIGEKDPIHDPGWTEHLLGLAYRHGLFVEFDYPYAVRKFQAGAAAKHAVSARQLADMYYHGIGVPRDVDRAMRWYRKEVLIAEENFKGYMRDFEQIKKTPLFGIDKTTGEVLHFTDPGKDFLGEAVNLFRQAVDDIVGRVLHNCAILREEGYCKMALQVLQIALDCLELADNTANKLEAGDAHRGNLYAEINRTRMLMGLDVLESGKMAWDEALKLYLKKTKNFGRIHAAAICGQIYGFALLQQGVAHLETARIVMAQALQIIEDSNMMSSRRALHELAQLLYRDLGHSHILSDPQTEDERTGRMELALSYLSNAERLWRERPDPDANPWASTFGAHIHRLKGNAYEYGRDYQNAYLCYWTALQEALTAYDQLGDLRNTKDFPLVFLQLYWQIITTLYRYRESFDASAFGRMIRNILEVYPLERFHGAHKNLAATYLQDLRQILENLEN